MLDIDDDEMRQIAKKMPLFDRTVQDVRAELQAKLDGQVSSSAGTELVPDDDDAGRWVGA